MSAPLWFIDEAGSPPASLFEGPPLPLADTIVGTERTSPELVAGFQARSDAEQTRAVRLARAAIRDDRPRIRELAALVVMTAVALDELAVTGTSLVYGEFLPEDP